MTNNSNSHNYGTWPSPLQPETLFQSRQLASCPVPYHGGLLFLLNMPDEENQQALMYVRAGDSPLRVSPPGFNLRTRVHEYGGLPYAVAETEIFYCNFADQAIYRQRFEPDRAIVGEPACFLGGSGTALRYADLLIHPQQNRLLCVREDHRASEGKADRVRNTLIAIALDEDQAAANPDRAIVLYDESDFVSSPSLSPDGRSLAFITWSHPNMPWDNTELQVARFCDDGLLTQRMIIDSDRNQSRQQPQFADNKTLYFLSDDNDFWNLRRVATTSDEAEALEKPIAPRSPERSESRNSDAVFVTNADCAAAPWQTGNRSYALMSDSVAVIAMVHDCHWSLEKIQLDDKQAPTGGEGLHNKTANADSQRAARLLSGAGQIEHVHAFSTQQISFLHADHQHYPSLRCLSLEQSSAQHSVLFRSARPPELDERIISTPQHFSFISNSDEQAHALLLPPKNPAAQGHEHVLPPLLVNVHGGPTGTARAVLNPLHQFWTSRGFAVLDLNHRGSTGYGREFRQRLYQEWGRVDIEDIIAAVQHLIRSESVDPERIAIRGGSAGGYAVLASLSASKLFAAGVSYYGVCDLELLAKDTHKFESRYLDQLVGPYPETKQRYIERSPIHNLSQITAPVLLLQGVEDRVVPLNQAETIFERLLPLNPNTELQLFAGEGHGFRKPESQIRALKAELDFYQKNLLQHER